jgi:hypothetical protein
MGTDQVRFHRRTFQIIDDATPGFLNSDFSLMMTDPDSYRAASPPIRNYHVEPFANLSLGLRDVKEGRGESQRCGRSLRNEQQDL